MPKVNPDTIATLWGFSGVSGAQVRAVLELASKVTVLGADMAPTHSAMIGLKGEEIPVHKVILKDDTTAWTVKQRYDHYHQELSALKGDMISLEDYTNQGDRGWVTTQIAENGALFKLAAENLNMSILKVAVPRVKSFVLRKKQVDKRIVIDFGTEITGGWVETAAKNRLGQVNQTTLGDVCDALTLALIGAFALAKKWEPRILDPFPAPFTRLFHNPEANGLSDMLWENKRAA